MKNAVKFAREILRKENAINSTASDKLQRYYRAALHRDRGELCYYCHCHGISIKEVFKIAKGR